MLKNFKLLSNEWLNGFVKSKQFTAVALKIDIDLLIFYCQNLTEKKYFALKYGKFLSSLTLTLSLSLSEFK